MPPIGKERAMRSQVKDVMTTSVVAVEEDTPYKDIVALLRKHRISAVPVVDSAGRVAGLVSESDLLLKEENPDAAWERPWFGQKQQQVVRDKAVAAMAKDLMTAPAILIVETTLVAEAARIMRAHGVKHLPVGEAGTGRLRGIVSRSDLLQIFLRPDEEIRDEIAAVLDELFPGVAEEVSVAVHDGVVTLRGEVSRRSVTGVLVRAVYGLEGVVSVVNDLSFSDDDLAAMTAAPA
jgi:CBS domain-containing protein